MKKTNIKKIICIMGGGVKGIFPCKLLKENKIENNFDVYLGTSVGSIIAAKLALEHGNSSIINNLEADFKVIANEIFKKKKLFGGPKYSLENAISILDKYFVHARCSDLKKRLVIVTTDLVHDETLYLKSCDFQNMRISEFVARSMCAPLYFSNIPDTKESLRIYSDGGAGFSNMPIDAAIMETLNFTEPCEIHAFGTGFVPLSQTELEKQYNRLIKKRWWGDVTEYLSLSTGGFARKTSNKMQINAGKYWASHMKPGYSFTYYDTILEKDIELDDWKAIQNINNCRFIKERTANE